MPLEILHLDDACVAINKPAGLLVHSTRIAAQVSQNAVRQLTKQLKTPVYPAHRLDRPTSGVLVFGLTPEMARALTEGFADRAVDKQYLAIVRGFTPDCGAIEKPLDDVYLREALMNAADDADDDSLPLDLPTTACRTNYHTLATTEVPYSAGKYPTSRYSLVQAVPVTGRTHQIRRHFKHIRHPILGDGRYGDHRHNHLARDQFGIKRLLLVARNLSFTHPVSGERIVITAPVGDAFDRALQGLGFPALSILEGRNLAGQVDSRCK